MDQLREGLQVYEPDGSLVGTLVAVHPEPPEGEAAPAIGYVEIRQDRPDRTRIIHLPLTQVLRVEGDRVVAEVDPDFVAAHDQQWIRVKPPMEA